MKLKSILFCFLLTGIIGFLLTSCERPEITAQAESVFFNEIDKAEHEASIVNSDLTTNEEVLENSAKSHPCAVTYTGGFACPGHATEALHRYLCWASYFAANPNESNRISRDTAYCDYILAYNFCNGTNYSCPSA